jgi:hypothetical protein
MNGVPQVVPTWDWKWGKAKTGAKPSIGQQFRHLR